MNVSEMLLESYIPEAKGESLLLLDVDDTIVTAKNIFIYRKLPNDKTEVKLTPEEFAKEKITAENNKFYDFRDFNDANSLARSIKTGLPIVSNLKIMDSYIRNGWKIGILTARGMEDVMYNTLKSWLKFRDRKGELKDIKLVRDLVFAMSDDEKKYPGSTSFDKKANVIKNLANSYDRIVFVDDDIQNLEKVKSLGLQNVHAKSGK